MRRQNSFLKKIMFVLASLVFLGGLSTLTGCHHSDPESRANWMTDKLSSKLDLNRAQKTKLDVVKQAFLEIRKAHKDDALQARAQIKELILSDKLDSAKVKAIIAQRQKIMDENFTPVFTKVADFHDSLTAEQKKKAAEMFDKFSDDWEK